MFYFGRRLLSNTFPTLQANRAGGLAFTFKAIVHVTVAEEDAAAATTAANEKRSEQLVEPLTCQRGTKPVSVPE